MGYEYRFTIVERDLAQLRLSPRIKTVVGILSAAPKLISYDDKQYVYDSGHPEWPNTVHVEDEYLWVTLSGRDKESWQLIDYLYRSLLDLCGRVEISEG